MKNRLRTLNKQLRREMTASEVAEKSRLAAENFINSRLFENSRVLMLYKPLKNETHTELIEAAALTAGKKLVFPVTNSTTGEITPFYAHRNTVFCKGAFSVAEPCNSHKADISLIDTVIVPGIAFDKKGARLGFGKGCYDRFLQKTTAVKVGFCYEFQVLDFVPAEEQDIDMDYLVTEQNIYECKKRV